jgi:hypothetical protein
MAEVSTIMVMSEATVPVTARALIQRINRALKKDDQVLRQARGERARLDLGDYYVVNTRRNFIDAQHVNVEALARELDVLKPYEHVVWDGEDE